MIYSEEEKQRVAIYLQQDQEAALRLQRMHAKQRQLYSSKKRTRVFLGGNRTGKTVWGAQEIVRFAFNTHDFRTIDLPIEIWCCCPSFDTQLDTTQKKLQQLIPAHRIKDITYIKKDVWGRILLDNGVILTFKSYEQGREKFQGAGKRIIWFDEEPPHDIWEECIVRQDAGVPLDMILTMTPVNGMTWVYTELYLNTVNTDVEVVVATWEDNPWLTKEQTDQMSRGLTQEALQVRRDGKFIKRVGLVCNWWDRSVHLSENVFRKGDWNIYRIVDFGWSSSKSCVLYIGVDTYDHVYIFDGIYENQLSDERLAEMMLEREKNFTVVKGWADNQPDRIDTLKRNGIICEPVKKIGGDDGWDTTRAEAMAQLGRVNPLTEKSLLTVSSRLTYYDDYKQDNINWFVFESESLRWVERKIAGEHQEQPRWDKDASRIPDSHFDAIDAFSYFAVMYNRRGGEYKELKPKHEKRTRRIINRITGY